MAFATLPVALTKVLETAGFNDQSLDGYVDDLDTAREVVDELVDNGWSGDVRAGQRGVRRRAGEGVGEQREHEARVRLELAADENVPRKRTAAQAATPSLVHMLTRREGFPGAEAFA